MGRNFINRVLRIIDPTGDDPFVRDFRAVVELLNSDADLMAKSDPELLELARLRATATPNA